MPLLVDLALVGFGNVGRRFVRLLDERRGALEHDHNLRCRIVGIATHRHGGAFDANGLDALGAATQVEGEGALPDRPASLDVIERLGRSRAPIRILVETTTLDIEAGEPARTHVRCALESGCSVVTANKGPTAFAYHELSEVARQHGASFRFEGAVMDGVPIFNLVRETMPTVTIGGFRGVINSTTNFILTKVEAGEDYDAALCEMQAQGIAEADPSLDVEGWDAAAKAAALANVFLDARVTPRDVERSGVTVETAAWARAAAGRNRRVRLVASAERGERPIVRPVELAMDDVLAGLRGMANALVLETDTLGRLVITQLDGGLTQTAYALLSDVIAIARSTRG